MRLIFLLAIAGCGEKDDTTGGPIDSSAPSQDLDGDGRVGDEDCDEADPDVHRDALERCDGLDQDCDGQIDEAALDLSVWYRDADEDGYGEVEIPAIACEAPEGYVDNADDCNDLSPLAFYGAAEVCDGVDNDCDLDTDEGVLRTFYGDADRDGYGRDDVSLEGCVAPSEGFSETGGDCDDFDSESFPGGLELSTCDGADQDCDGSVDEGARGEGTSSCPATHCLELLEAEASTPSGPYWVQPDPDHPALEVWCDMDTDDGGWTLLVTLDPATVTFATVEDWPSEPAVTGDAPYQAGLYKGSLMAFSEVREEIGSGVLVGYGAGLSEAELELIRQSYGYESRLTAAPLFSDMPDCTLEYQGSNVIQSCSHHAGLESLNTDTFIGWVGDPLGPYYYWYARGNCCSTAGGSAAGSDPDGTLWARTWFR